MKPVVLCYEKCSTCKTALKWVEESGYAVQVRPIKEENPTAAELKEWHEMSGEEQYQLLSTDGMLVKRPLLITDQDVCPGFQEAVWHEALMRQA